MPQALNRHLVAELAASSLLAALALAVTSAATAPTFSMHGWLLMAVLQVVVAARLAFGGSPARYLVAYSAGASASLALSVAYSYLRLSEAIGSEPVGMLTSPAAALAASAVLHLVLFAIAAAISAAMAPVFTALGAHSSPMSRALFRAGVEGRRSLLALSAGLLALPLLALAPQARHCIAAVLFALLGLLMNVEASLSLLLQLAIVEALAAAAAPGAPASGLSPSLAVGSSLGLLAAAPLCIRASLPQAKANLRLAYRLCLLSVLTATLLTFYVTGDPTAVIVVLALFSHVTVAALFNSSVSLAVANLACTGWVGAQLAAPLYLLIASSLSNTVGGLCAPASPARRLVPHLAFVTLSAYPGLMSEAAASCEGVARSDCSTHRLFTHLLLSGAASVAVCAALVTAGLAPRATPLLLPSQPHEAPSLNPSLALAGAVATASLSLIRVAARPPSWALLVTNPLTVTAATVMWGHESLALALLLGAALKAALTVPPYCHRGLMPAYRCFRRYVEPLARGLLLALALAAVAISLGPWG
ncbi:MAG: hypothetical protein DRJ56_06940 [Thermoprotei archaeon]|nr:MAG: hypothetical protein DRJ56_06940 [Thermoprotei archaeon]